MTYITYFGIVDPAKDTWKTNKKKYSRENYQNVSPSIHDDAFGFEEEEGTRILEI